MWFYVHNKKAEGPVSEEILHRLLQTNTLPPDALVWQEGRADWLPADRVFRSLAGDEDFAVLGGTASVIPPPLPDDEPNDEPAEGAIVTPRSVAFVPRPEPEPAPRTKPDRSIFFGGLLIIAGLLLCFFFMLATLHRAPARASNPPPTSSKLAPPSPVSTQPKNPGGVPLRRPTPTVLRPPLPTPLPRPVIPSVKPLAPEPGKPTDFFFMVEKNGAIYVLGRKESLVALVRDGSLANTHDFPGRGPGGKDLRVEGDADRWTSQKLRGRLIATYDTRFGTSLELNVLTPKNASPTNPDKVTGGKIIEVKAGGNLVVDRGTNHGLRQGALLRIYEPAPELESGERYRGRIQIITEGALESVARSLEPEHPKLEVGDRCVFRTHDNEPWKPARSGEGNPASFFQTIKTNGVVYVLGTQAGVDRIRADGRLPVAHMVRSEGPRGLNIQFEAGPGSMDMGLSDRLRAVYDARFGTSTRRGGVVIFDSNPNSLSKMRGGVTIVDVQPSGVGVGKPDEVFLIMRNRDRFAVAGTRAGGRSRGAFANKTAMRYIEPSLQTRWVDFEIDPEDPTMLERLVHRYNLVQGTHLRPEYFRGIGTGGQPAWPSDWRTKLKRFPDLTFGQEQVFVRLETSEGEIRLEMMPATAPNHVSNFVWLSAIGYYDGLTLHRAIPGFMVQGGCPFGKGSGGPGYQFSGEFDPPAKHDRAGLLSMANRGPGTDGSQFFLTFAPAKHLDGKHTIFGEVDQGMKVLRAIEALGSPNGATSKPITIIKANVEWGR